jgi:uncharacterized membrane protein YkvI
MSNTLFTRIFLPGFLLQSVLVGGGYATGRELVEFFLNFGPLGGLLGLFVAMLGFSLVAALTFELARVTKSYTYRRFFQKLLGRGWFLYELAYFCLGLLVMAVIGSAAGEMVSEHLGVSGIVGTIGLMLSIGFLVFYGTSLIEKVLAGWSFLLYASYGVFVFLYLYSYGDRLVENLSLPVQEGWLLSGIKYIGFNVGLVPIILFCVAHMETRKDALWAGVWAGPIATIPALLFFLPMIASYPDILSASVPSDYMMQNLHSPWIKIVFYTVVFGTFVETGAAYTHAINERVAEAYQDQHKTLPQWIRPVIAIVAFSLAIVLAEVFGLVSLIADGYGSLTWFFIAVYILPLMSYGVWRIYTAGRQTLEKHQEVQ